MPTGTPCLAVVDLLDLLERRSQRVRQLHAAGLQADHHQLVETVVALEDLVGHPPQRPMDVVGVHHLGPGNENAPVGARQASFAFCHRQEPSCP